MRFDGDDRLGRLLADGFLMFPADFPAQTSNWAAVHTNNSSALLLDGIGGIQHDGRILLPSGTGIVVHEFLRPAGQETFTLQVMNVEVEQHQFACL